ncbi:MAG TPA: type I restriction endonuclease subunit S [Faecalibacterium sp.]|nr:type I restriction endonuclease subunit S [Faecalibacterium sp.]
MAKLGDIATYINGYAFKPQDWSDEGIPIIRIQDLTGNSYQANRYNGEYASKYEVNDGDVLISWSASLGVYIWHGEKAVLNQHIFKVVFDKERISKDFFVHQVGLILENAASDAHGATMKHLTKPVFDALPFYLPPYEKQCEIAEVLDKVTSLISLRKQQLAKLDELVKARFVEMFGTFPANPFRWSIGKIQDVVSDVRYGSSRPAVEGGKYPYLRMNNITYSGELDLRDTKRIDIPDSELDKCTVRRGDVLFNRTNSKELVGKTCVYNRDELMVLAGFVIRVRINERIRPEVLSAFLNMDFSKRMLIGMCKTAIGQANINAKELQNIDLYIPPIELQDQFVTLKNKIDQQKQTVQQSLEKLELLKKALMQEYFG